MKPSSNRASANIRCVKSWTLVAPTVWLCASTLDYPEGGGHFWVYLNWALGLRSLGCEVVWLEVVKPGVPAAEVRKLTEFLDCRLGRYGLPPCVVVSSPEGDPVTAAEDVADIMERAREADLLLNVGYESCNGLLPLFRRTALLDIDPGITQILLAEGRYNLPRHDLYFTIGETVGRPDSLFPTGGISSWRYTPPCVALDWWPPVLSPDGSFTTVSHWESSNEWISIGSEFYMNDKRSGFQPFLKLPSRTCQRLELAICLGPELTLDPYEEEERLSLLRRGWQVVHSHTVTATPADYQAYIQQSRGEFSSAKRSCIRLQNAWVSDRTLCYLASGKPAVVQHTGPSRLLPDSGGIHRFRDLDGAARALERVADDYEKECRLARELAEEHFDARRIVGALLEQAL